MADNNRNTVPIKPKQTVTVKPDSLKSDKDREIDLEKIISGSSDDAFLAPNSKKNNSKRKGGGLNVNYLTKMGF